MNLFGACGPSRICGMRWRGQYRKPSLSCLPEIAMSFGSLCHTPGVKLLRLSVTFNHWMSPWNDEWNQWSKHRGSGLFFIKEASFWKPVLRVKVVPFLRKWHTSRNKNVFKPCMFAHNLFVCSKRIKVGVKWAAWGPFRFWRPTKIWKTEYVSKLIVCKQKHSIW